VREDRQRLDKWLWFARFAKTRALAERLVESGHVRINGQRTDNAAKGIKIGDVITVAMARITAVVRVENLGERRGSAPQARELYSEFPPGEEILARNDGKR
jgi:ribosome-associated heat shock protein Hsp15